MFLGCLERVYVRFAICGTYFVSLEIKIRLRIWIYIPVGHYGEDSDVDVKGITVFISKAMAAFVTVAQEKSLKRTAEKLCLTVPPVSRMLKNTEHWFGEKLVIIGRNSVTLTPFGINVYRQILPHYLSLQHISKRKSRAPVTISSPVVHAAFFDEIMQIVVPDIPECPVIKYAEHIHDRDRRCMPNHDRFRCHFAVLHGSYHTFSCALYSLHVTCTEPVTGTTDWLNSEQLSSHCREWTLQLLIHRLSCRLLTCFVDKSSQKTFRQLCTCGRSHFLRLQLPFRHRSFTGHLRRPRRKAGEPACPHFRMPGLRRCLSDAPDAPCSRRSHLPAATCFPLYSRLLAAADAVPCTLTRAALPTRHVALPYLYVLKVSRQRRN